ncbi:hypothetical protein FXB40_05025 [Bradyrhizobium rifense]|uniref:Uncharacterized protein n=2 Tax=Bradyrhizobium rifense TaxID=515499 RepID=A0A5D3KLS7_9BRAD|nr:hypothetical protein FXB40_05025 [Bradyrhizobium rifense]
MSHFRRLRAFQDNRHSIAFIATSGRTLMSFAGQVRPIVAAMVVLAATIYAVRAEEANDYPTSARAEYVYGCMKANGETRQAIEQCSCSIDVVASIVSYERYVTAETALSMSQVQGNLGTQFRTSEQANSAVNDLRRAQAEAEVRCF